MVAVWRVTDGAEPGEMPVETITRKVVLLYEDRTIGATRYYAARQAQVQIDRVLRVPDPGVITLREGQSEARAPITTDDVAEVETGERYRIDRVVRVRDVYPPTLELTLRRIDPTPEVTA